jgi:hypothetical protein
MHLMAIVLSHLRESAIRSALGPILIQVREITPVGVANLANDIFASLAEATGNHQTLQLVRHLNERLHYARIAAAVHAEAAHKELQTIIDLDVANLLKATRRRIDAYHVRKISYQQNIIQDH